MKFLCLSVFLMSSNVMHVGHIAEYNYQLIDEQVHLNFSMDKEDIMLLKLTERCDMNSTTAHCLTNYLNERSSFVINGKNLKFQLLGSQIRKERIYLQLIADVQVDAIDGIAIKNRVFIEFDPEFKRRILVDIGSFQGSYLLSGDRDELVLDVD